MSNIARAPGNPAFSPKDPAEVVDLGFDFSALTSAPTSPVVSAAFHSGAEDPAPEAILSGAAAVVGATVVQRVIGGVAGTDYALRCQVDTANGQRFVLTGVLPVRTA